MVARALTLSLAAIWTASALVPARLAPRHRRPTCRFAGDDGDEFDVDVLLMETEERMDKSIGALQNNLGTLRTGRASPDILARVVVDYYGAETPLNQLASVSVSSSIQAFTSSTGARPSSESGCDENLEAGHAHLGSLVRCSSVGARASRLARCSNIASQVSRAGHFGAETRCADPPAVER